MTITTAEGFLSILEERYPVLVSARPILEDIVDECFYEGFTVKDFIEEIRSCGKFDREIIKSLHIRLFVIEWMRRTGLYY